MEDNSRFINCCTDTISFRKCDTPAKRANVKNLVDVSEDQF
jgi:hypothetical protein